MATVHGLESQLEQFLNRFKPRFETLIRILSTPGVSEASIQQVIEGYVLMYDIMNQNDVRSATTLIFRMSSQ